MSFVCEPITGRTVFDLMSDARDQQAWEHFCDRYAPLIRHWAKMRRLQDAVCDDVCQEVLTRLFLNLKTYDRSRGSFRGWLRTIVHRACMDAYRAIGRHPNGTGDSVLNEILAETADPRNDPIEDLIHAMDAEYEESLRKQALDAVRGRVDQENWDAFWRVRFHGEDPQAVAVALNKSVGSVYMSCHRLGRMAAEELERLKGTGQDG